MFFGYSLRLGASFWTLLFAVLSFSCTLQILEKGRCCVWTGNNVDMYVFNLHVELTQGIKDDHETAMGEVSRSVAVMTKFTFWLQVDGGV